MGDRSSWVGTCGPRARHFIVDDLRTIGSVINEEAKVVRALKDRVVHLEKVAGDTRGDITTLQRTALNHERSLLAVTTELNRRFEARIANLEQSDLYGRVAALESAGKRTEREEGAAASSDQPAAKRTKRALDFEPAVDPTSPSYASVTPPLSAAPAAAPAPAAVSAAPAAAPSISLGKARKTRPLYVPVKPSFHQRMLDQLKVVETAKNALGAAISAYVVGSKAREHILCEYWKLEKKLREAKQEVRESAQEDDEVLPSDDDMEL